MPKDLILSVVVKGILGLLGFILLTSGAMAISGGSDLVGGIAFLIGLILIIGLKTRGS